MRYSPAGVDGISVIEFFLRQGEFQIANAATGEFKLDQSSSATRYWGAPTCISNIPNPLLKRSTGVFQFAGQDVFWQVTDFGVQTPKQHALALCHRTGLLKQGAGKSEAGDRPDQTTTAPRKFCQSTRCPEAPPNQPRAEQHKESKKPQAACLAGEQAVSGKAKHKRRRRRLKAESTLQEATCSTLFGCPASHCCANEASGAYRSSPDKRGYTRQHAGA